MEEEMDSPRDDDAAEDGALATELEAAKRVYSAIAGLGPSAADRVCQWAMARRTAEDYQFGGATLAQKAAQKALR